MRGMLAGALALCLSAPATSATAQTRVIVRAETRLELRASGTPGSLVIEGALRDDLGAPLAERDIEIVLRAADTSQYLGGVSATTGPDGAFRAVLSAPSGECVVSARFGGESLYVGSEAEHAVDVRLAPVELTLDLAGGARLDLDEPTHALSIVAHSMRGAAGLEITLTSETGAPIGRATTDAEGHATAVLESAVLGGPSAGRIVASTAPDAERAAARVEIPVVRFRATTTRLGISRTDDEIVYSGTLTTSAGPRPDEAVSLYAGDALVGTALTDDAGRYSARVPLSDLRALPDPVALRARFQSDAPWYGSSESPPIDVRVGSRLPSLRSVLIVLSLALALVIVLGTLRRPAQRPELAVVRSSVVPSARVPGRHVRIGLRLRDGRTRAAITGAEVRLVAADGTASVVLSDETGRADATLASRTALTVLSSGYEELRLTVPVPHRGEWLDAELRLSSLRDAATAPLRPIAERALGSADAAASATAHEVLVAAERRGPQPVLGALVARVERAAYGAVAPTRGDVESIRGDAADALGELERARDASPPRAP